MLCESCFWNINKYRKRQKSSSYFPKIDPKEWILCPFFGALPRYRRINPDYWVDFPNSLPPIHFCNGYVLEERTSYWVNEAKKDLGLDDDGFKFFFLTEKEQNEINFYELTKEQKWAESCKLVACRPTRMILQRIQGCDEFKKVVFKDVKSLTDEKYDRLFRIADKIIRELEGIIHKKEKRHNRRAIIAYSLNKASSMLKYPQITRTFLITQEFLEQIFMISGITLRQYSSYVINIDINNI